MTLQTYIQADSSIDFDSEVNNIIESIPVGVYIPRYSINRGIYLSSTNNFKYLPEYYLLDKFEEYVLQSFEASSKSIGALYIGLKGSGKTKRAQKLALDSGMPILYIQDLSIINQPGWKDIISSDTFNNWVIFIDEYEKKLEDDTSVALLDWLDGSVNTKQLFILIGNEKAANKFSNPLIDRLSRVLWRKTFNTLKEAEVKELVNKLSARTDKEELLDSIVNIPVLSLDNTLQIINITNQLKDVNIAEVVSMLNIEFKLFEEFVLCNEQDQLVTSEGRTIGLRLNKNKLTFEEDTLYIYFNQSTIKQLGNLNDDLDTTEDVFITCRYADLDIKYINNNRLKVQVCYSYESLQTQDIVKSDASITLYFIKESYYDSLALNRRYLDLVL